MCIYIKFLLPALAFFFSLSLGKAQEKKTNKKKVLTHQVDNLSQSLPNDPEVIIGKLSNGLTYYIRQNTEPKNRAVLYLVNRVGSNQEADDQQGLAHFLEHMAFNGTHDFPKNELINYLQKSGVQFGADVNAYTGFDETVYQLPIPSDSATLFERGFDILANWAGMISLEADEIDAERGIILEEARARGKNADERMQKTTLPVILNNARYAKRLPIGKEDILKNFKYETIRQFYKDWYRPDLQAVIAVGDFDVKKVEIFIKNKFSSLKNPSPEKPKLKYPVPANKGSVVKIVTDEEYPYTSVSVMVKRKAQSLITRKDYVRKIKTDMFNDMLNNRLHELNSKPDMPFLSINCGYGNILGTLDAYTSMVFPKPGEIETSLKILTEENARVLQYGFTSTEMERVKNSLLKGEESLWQERNKINSAYFVEKYVKHFLEQEAIPSIDYEFEFYKTEIPRITLSDVNSLAKEFIKKDNRTIILQAPHKDKEKLPSEETLLAWIDHTSKDISNYVDDVSNEPLLKEAPNGGSIVTEKNNRDIGTTEWVLSNGLKIILKPTDFQNEQIQISAFSFGGTSLASDADFRSADFGSSVFPTSGVGSLTDIQLEKRLSGKNLYMTPYIDELMEGLSGSTAPEELETALQLIYLYFTAPRKDTEIWKVAIQQAKESVKMRGVTPESVYGDTINAVINSHNKRRMPLTLREIEDLNMDKAFSFYKDRFADASDFTFVIVGNFEVEKIKELLAKYLGSLPATKRGEIYRDLEIHAPTGQVVKTVYRGLENKSSVRLIFYGNYNYTQQNNVQLQALTEILKIKLTERLREKEGGVYSPAVNMGIRKIPAPRYSVMINFSCATENVDKLISATLDEIGKLKKNDATEIDVEKFIAEQKRTTELQLKSNDFWVEYLINQYMNNENPDEILEAQKNLRAVNPASVKAAANDYLSGVNLARFILMPEKKGEE